MANNINRLNFNITSYNYTGPDGEAAKSSLEKKSEVEIKSNQSTMGASEILGYLANINTDLVPVKTQKTVDVNKYVTPEQEARIAEFIKGFEADYDEAAQIAVDEFGISKKAANDIALAYINASY